MAYIALGAKAENDLSFYAAVSQALDEKVSQDIKKMPEDTSLESTLMPTTAKDDTIVVSEVIHEEYQADVEDSSVPQNSETLLQLQTVTEHMKQHLLQKDQDFNMVSGIGVGTGGARGAMAPTEYLKCYLVPPLFTSHAAI